MATVMEMPKLSDTMKEGAVGKWLKKEGDKVTAGAPVVEIETDKATMEFESPASGTLLKIVVGDGQTCSLNAPIAVIGKPEENWQEALDAHAAKKKPDGKGAPKAEAKPSSAKAASPAPAPAKSGSSPASAAAPQSAKPAAQSAPQKGNTGEAAAAGQSGGDGRVKASPLAKKMAADKGIDLARVEGSGPNGRVIMRDLENVQGGGAGTTARTTPAGSGATTTVPLSMMRKTIARRLTESVVTAPHFYLGVSLDMGNLLAWRKNALTRLPEDKKFSVNDLLVLLVSRALARHPDVNASWQENSILQYHDVHMGIAVALPGGLVTPVIRNAHLLGVLEIAEQTRALIAKAREGKLQSEDYSGGTFTISNLGMNGIEEFTAIINPPQAAILAVGATIPTPVVDAKGAIVVQQKMRVTLSCDHRVIDGAVGSEFLKTLKLFVEDPMSALLLG